MRRAIVVTLVVGAAAGCRGAATTEIRAPLVAAASSLTGPLAEIAASFAREDGSRVELVFGSSGALTRQIVEGATFEVFLSADESLPARLTEAGLTRDPGVVYARGRLAVFAPAGSPLTVDPQLEGLARLVNSDQVTRFAIANPEVAPYGQAAEAVLRSRGLWDALRPRLVLGDTIAQAAQFAATGDTVGGLLALSVLRTPGFAGRGAHAVIPESDHPPLAGRMVLLRGAAAVASRFYTYVTGPAARRILETHGYATTP